MAEERGRREEGRRERQGRRGGKGRREKENKRKTKEAENADLSSRTYEYYQQWHNGKI